MVRAAADGRRRNGAPRLGERAARGPVTYDASVAPSLLEVPPIKLGAVPAHHIKLIDTQLAKLRNALFVARALGRALVLPPTLCSCELGFWPNHVAERCTANDHKMLVLPYVCALDHYLDPRALDASPFAHREPFFDNPHTPTAPSAAPPSPSARRRPRLGRRRTCRRGRRRPSSRPPARRAAKRARPPL